ncbi:ABC transporter ATP-binding protein [Mucilaginibacter hurinus]|uniref:ABC transporter ATP-binding protein n=1 Tax=Mucilaginibacter hurinus TaxID=2201324 RepID=A0A367GMN5_9SPHI|nr:ABC transporter ATP-binding protein [Mucilaginibacter hurinus]RCH54295.1 ABC transporter ATP-binding protein [Mucilaginibacter hurinus]
MIKTSLLKANAVSKLYPGERTTGVKNVTLDIKPGEITAVIGASGSGKSTLLKLFFGLISPDKGEIRFKGDRVWGPEEKLIPGHDEMKMVTQHTDDLNLFAKVWDNVATLLPNTDLKAKKEKTDNVLKQLNMTHLATRQVVDLSGGEKQRVAIARAMVTQPTVLLLDEPFNQVDTSFREALQQDIRQVVKDTGLTVVMVSHDPAEVLSMADELVVIKDGEILEKGQPRNLYKQPGHLYTAQLLANCNVLTSKQAKLLGVTSKKETIAIYTDYIDITKSWVGKAWEVKQVMFKGFFEELLVQQDNITVRALNKEQGKYKEGDKVNLKAWGYLEY